MYSTKYLITTTLVVAGFLLSGCQQNNGDVSLKTDIQKVSYAYGLDVGKVLKKQGMSEVDFKTFKAGLTDGLQDNEAQMSQDEIQKVMNAYAEKTASDRRKMMKELSDNNLKKSREFLEKNKEKEDVKTTASGLQYKILEQGNGPSPDTNDEVTVHYKGTLIDGTVFDSSYERGNPANFSVDGVIKGWTEGLQLMEEGAEYKFFIPPNMAYGARGAGNSIGPNEALIFEVKLLNVKKID